MIKTAQQSPGATDRHATLFANAKTAYEEQGFALLPGVLPGDLINACREMINLWVDFKAGQWVTQGLISDIQSELPFRTRFHTLWNAAGRPRFTRSPRQEMLRRDPRRMYEILRHPALSDIAAAFLGSDEVVSHSVWNSRPKGPDDRFTDTPWHQDAQYFTDQANIHIMTLWFPLHDVDAESSCLAVAPGCHRRSLYEGVEDTSTGFIGIDATHAHDLPEHPVVMSTGDALIFPQRMPHRARPNRSSLMRYSMDFRFVRLDEAAPGATELGLITRSNDPSKLTSFDDWLAKWEHAPTW